MRSVRSVPDWANRPIARKCAYGSRMPIADDRPAYAGSSGSVPAATPSNPAHNAADTTRGRNVGSAQVHWGCPAARSAAAERCRQARHACQDTSPFRNTDWAAAAPASRCCRNAPPGRCEIFSDNATIPEHQTPAKPSAEAGRRPAPASHDLARRRRMSGLPLRPVYMVLSARLNGRTRRAPLWRRRASPAELTKHKGLLTASRS